MRTAAGSDPDGESRAPATSGLVTALKIGALVFALVLGGIAVAAWVSGEPETLSFDYEGFD